MTRQERWNLVAANLGILTGLILFLLLVPAVCVIAESYPGPTLKHCSSVVTGLLESELGKTVPTRVSALGALLIPPGGGLLTWYLLRRQMTRDR